MAFLMGHTDPKGAWGKGRWRKDQGEVGHRMGLKDDRKRGGGDREREREQQRVRQERGGRREEKGQWLKRTTNGNEVRVPDRGRDAE